MAITLDSMTSIAMLNQGTVGSASTSANQTTGAFALANQCISQKLNSTDVQLSALVKSVLALPVCEWYWQVPGMLEEQSTH